MFLSKYALKNPVAILMLSILMAVLALVSIQYMPIDILPSFPFPVLQIVTPYTGADPLTVERSVTYPIEKAVSAVQGISYTQSVSSEGLSIVKAYFNWGTSVNSALVQTIQQVNSILNYLPPGVGIPYVLKFDISNFPVIAVALQSSNLNQRQLYDIAFNGIEPQVSHITDVASAPVMGGRIRQINVLVNPYKLAGYGLTLQDVYHAVGNANFIYPSGDIKIGSLDYRVYNKTQFNHVTPLNNVVVADRNGVPIQVKNIGRVVDGAAQQTEVVTINGHYGVMMWISKEPETNTVQCVANVEKDLPHIMKQYPNIRYHYFFNQAIPVKNSIHSLIREAAIGAILAALVILIFLRSFLSTAFVAVSMPLSAAFAVFLLFLNGQTFNTFTLGGLALAMGRLVDDAIVVIENIYRHLHLGEQPLQAALKGTEEVGMPVLASTLTTIIVFLPILFIQGFLKILFEPLALTVAFALIGSYLCSMTIIPVLSRRYLRVEKPAENPANPKEIGGFYQGLTKTYGNWLRWVLHHKSAVAVGILALIMVTLPISSKIGRELIPQDDENMFMVVGRLPIGTRLHDTLKVVREAETIIRSVIPKKDLTVIASDCGIPPTTRGSNAAAAAFTQNPGPHGFTIRVNLIPASERKTSVFAFVSRVRKALYGKFPGVQLYITPAGIMYFLLNQGAKGEIDIQVRGYNLSTDFKLSHEVADVMRSVRGCKDTFVQLQNNYPELHVEVSRTKAALLGLNENQIADTILTALDGNLSYNSTWTDPKTGYQYNLVTEYMRRFRVGSLQNLKDVPFVVPDGSDSKIVPLRDFARIVFKPGPLQITRQNEIREIDITANAVGRPLTNVVNAILRKVHEKVKMPPGYSLGVTGQAKEAEKSFGRMIPILLLSVIFIYAIMASQFRSLVDPFIIMFTVPLGLIGVVWMLYFTHTAFSIESFMGVITMIGIVVSNGILLVDFANHKRRQGLNAEEAVIEAGKVRLRPILMTAIATLVGLIPMALGIGAGSEVHAPLARAVIGGLSVSTFLTLFFIPILYVWLEKKETQIGDDF